MHKKLEVYRLSTGTSATVDTEAMFRIVKYVLYIVINGPKILLKNTNSSEKVFAFFKLKFNI